MAGSFPIEMLMKADAFPDMTGKTVLLTGGTGGIGLQAAVQLARLDAKVVITGRSARRIDAALARIRAAAGSDQVEALQADFASLQAVRALAGEFLAAHERLDVLINNVGSVNPGYSVTEDGFETTFAVNHLAPFLLTNLLLAKLRASTPARIVNVASTAHYGASMHFNDLGFEHGYRLMRAYARSKLANVLFTRELATRLVGTGVTVNAVHPGTVSTGIWLHGAPRWARGLTRVAFAPARLFMRSPEQGGQTIVHAATSPQLAGKSGLYLEDQQIATPSELARDDTVAQTLWARSMQMTGLDAA